MPPSIDGVARILIVDDTESNIRLLEFALRRGGYQGVTSTTNPKNVTALHVAEPYDLILLDLQMPAMSGFEVMKELRALENGSRVGILVMSADPSSMMQSLEAGGNSFLSKPFLLGDVLDRVKTMLKERNAA